jgi:hypothetical protein
VGYSKDLGLLQFGIGQWAGHLVADMAKKIGVAKGAVLQAAYAVAIAEQQNQYTINGKIKGNDVLLYLKGFHTLMCRCITSCEHVWCPTVAGYNPPQMYLGCR